MGQRGEDATGSVHAGSGGGGSFFGGGPPGRYNAVPADGNTDGGAYGTGGASSDAAGHGGNGVKGVIIVEEYDRFKNTWDDRTQKAIEFAEAPEIVQNNDEIFLIRNK